MGRGRGRPRKRARGRAEVGDEPGEEDADLFPVGAEVEVRNDDPGFAGAFYEATVVERALAGGGGRGGGYLVSYSTLEVEGEGASGGYPLRERAAAADVRPRPPPPEPGRAFAVHEMVEAFHNEGWWSGVVSAVPPPPAAAVGQPRRYKVAFPTAREVLEFQEAALRPHLLFKGGIWVPSADAGNGRPPFREGAQVEVSRFAESFGESWNPATVLKVIGATNFLVQYRHVGDDGEVITEIVDSQYIRPSRIISRMDSKYRFSPSSHIEVFHQGSWWPGVIIQSSGTGFTKKYVVRLKSHTTDMDDVDFEDVLTVENTQLRPRFDWSGRKWVHRLTMEPATKGPPLSLRKSPISAAMASCNDTDEINDSSGSCLHMKLNNADVVSGPISSLLSVCSDNNEIKHKLCSYSEELVMQQHAVLALGSQLSLPLPLTTGISHLTNNSSLSPCSHVEVSSQMISMLPESQTRQPQASLFGLFGQLRSLPQGPVLGMQLHSPDFGLVVGLKKALSDQALSDQKQSTDESCYLMECAEHKIFDVESRVDTDLSRKRKEYVALQTSEELGGNLHISKKRTVDKTTEGTNNNAASSKEGRQEKQIIDENRPSGIDDIHHVDYIRAQEHVATKVPDSIESSVLSFTSTVDNHNPSEVNLFCSDSSTQNGMEATKYDKRTLSVEEDTCKEFSDSFLVMDDIDNGLILLPSAKNYGADGHDHELYEDSNAAMTECMKIVPAENLSTLSPVIFGGALLNILSSSDNCELAKMDDMDKLDHQENMTGLANNVSETQDASILYPFSGTSVALLKGHNVKCLTKKFVGNEQNAESHQVHSLAIVECPAETQVAEKLAITPLPSVDLGSSTEAEICNSLSIAEDVEGTPIFKCVADRTSSSCGSLLQRSVLVHEIIMADRPSDSLAIVNLPFVKTSPLWAHIEAMEIFTEAPQRPNFHRLLKHVPELLPELREGMALGLMLSFANLAESINGLSIEHDDVQFEEKMKGLSLLEEDGFDVRDLRSRVECLLHIKNCRIELQHAMKKLEEKIARKETDDQELGRQIGMLNVTVIQLEQHAYLLRCRMKSAVLEKLNNAVEISGLRMEATELERSYLSAGQHISSTVDAHGN